jgi:primosomal protein N' (replication factor Y) (superfamily II helicase)
VKSAALKPQATDAGAAGQYAYLELPHRVRDLALPHVERVDMGLVNRGRRGVHLLSPRLEFLLKATIDAGKQAILLLNRRGYSNFVHCPSCSHVVSCKYCDTTMTYHRSSGVQVSGASLAQGVHTGQLHCHYCLAVNPLPEQCPECGKKLSLFGLGTQRVEEELAKKFPELKFARVDSDSMHSAKDYAALLGRFARGEIQVLLGTQMIAKGLDYPNVTLVGVISGDTALALPDFRAAERTFQLITQVAGRAGRGDTPGRVVLQTFLPDDPTLAAAIKQDYIGFARSELSSRREVGLPPFTRMVRIILRDQEIEKVHKLGEDLAAKLAAAITAADAVQMKGPMPCAISRIAGYFRHQIVLTSPSAAKLQAILATLRGKGDLSKMDRIAVDVDPVSLL